MTTALWIAGAWVYLVGIVGTYRHLKERWRSYDDVPAAFSALVWPLTWAGAGPFWAAESARNRRAARRLAAERELRDAERLLREVP